MSQNVLVVHGGGPTAVINASLYGVIEEAKRNPEVGKVYGAIGGTGAIFSETFIDLTSFDDEKLKLLLHTPASAIGSSRYPLYEKDYEKMVDIFKKHDIKYVLLNGGNGTMDACGHIYEVCKDQDIKVVGIPKTIDNDIAMTDHSPGYGSAARFIAASTQEVGEDVKSLPIHVCIMEAMGRNAGWITAASALARRKQGDAPHLIHYGDGMGTNPIMMMQALSAQVLRFKRVMSDNCVIICASTCNGYFHDERWPYLRELYDLFQHDHMNTLPDMNRLGEYFATNEEYIRKYRYTNAFHPFHGFSMMSCGHIAEMNTSAIYIVGAEEPGYARGMGLKTRATFEEALEDAKKKYVGQEPNILALPMTFKKAAVHLCMKDPAQDCMDEYGHRHPCCC